MSEERFKSYDWESDEEWKRIKNSLEIPVHLNAQAVILKRQRKYYKVNIDPDYTPPAVEASTPSPSVNSVSQTRPSSTPSSTSSQTPRQPSSSSSSGGNNSIVNTYFKYNDASVHGNQLSQVYRNICYQNVYPCLNERPGLIEFITAFFTLLFSMIYLIPFVPVYISNLVFSLALKCVVGLCFVRIVTSTTAFPSLSLEAVKKFMVYHMMNTPALIPLFIAIFHHFATPIMPIAIWNIALSYPICIAYYKNSNITHIATIREKSSPYISSYLNYIYFNYSVHDLYLCFVEFYVLFVSVLHIFTPARSIIYLAAFSSLMLMKFVVSKPYRFIAHTINKSLTKSLPSVVLSKYEYVSGKLYSLVNPVRQ